MRDRDLTADCERCCGLCCVAPPFSASEDFAIDKGAQVACPHLSGDFRCTIHEHLGAEGFRGCAIYDCYGAGQQVTQTTFAGRNWHDPEIAESMFEVFMVMRRLYELLMYLTEALRLPQARPLYTELQLKLAALEGLTEESAQVLRQIEVDPHKREVDALLLRVGDLVREVGG